MNPVASLQELERLNDGWELVRPEEAPLGRRCPMPQKKMLPAILVLLGSVGGLAVWENQWQQTQCARILSCGLNETGEVGDIFQIPRQVERFQRFLQPPRWIDSNWWRSQLWFGEGQGGLSFAWLV